MEHTIDSMLQDKETLSQQITELVNNFVDKYDIDDVELCCRDERVIGQKYYHVQMEVKYF